MSERRAIKSTIWDDEFFGGELSLLEKLVWIGLFSKCADCQGRLVDNPSLIASKIFPYGDANQVDIENCLVAFGDKIIRYEIKDKFYIQIKSWWENQPMQYAVPSNYPAPEGWKDRVRTNYKGKQLVYNWPDVVDTQDGIQLMTLIETLPRMSSWIDYVGRLNPNPNPNPNPVEKDVNKNSSSMPKKQKPATPHDLDIEIEKVDYAKLYTNITGNFSLPSDTSKQDWIIDTIRNIHDEKKDGTLEYLKQFFTEWLRRYPKSKTNTAWLEWASSGVIPERKENVINQPFDARKAEYDKRVKELYSQP